MDRKCLGCNAQMYERKVKKGPNKGKMGWGCPCCFMMLPEDEPQIGYVMDMLEDIYITIEGKDIDTLKHLLSEEDTDEPFDFWQKPSQDKEDGK